MAAALLRGGTVFYLKYVFYDIRHIIILLITILFYPAEKARPQPAIDIPKLLEQLFSQRRVSAVKASSKPLPCPGGSTKPSTATSIKTPASSLSQTKPAVSVSAAASTLKPVINVSSENSPLFKKAPNSPPAIDSQASPKSVSHSTPESVVGLTADSSPTSKTSMQSLPCFPTASAAAAVVYKKTISCSSTTSVPPSAVPTHAAKQSSTATSIEKQINTTEGRGETTVRPAEFTVAPVLPTPVDTVQIKVETSEFKEGPLIANAAAKDSNKSPTPLSVEDTTEPAICAKSIPTFESRTAPVEPTVAVTIDSADQVVGNGLTNTGADTTSGITFLENAMKFPSVSVANKDSMVESHIFSSGTCVGTGEENGGEGGKERAVEEVIQEGALTAEPVEDEFGVIEAITLESGMYKYWTLKWMF
ncbi:mucin-5AC-like [Lampris incognitus]|uniref:mucin-5AC-like n=1 Tax=Lampris incognitus TaxID=2546036 RepID=UPI0024B4A7B5|nr:mucin-5AC-like [Lampris incognitus]